MNNENNENNLISNKVGKKDESIKNQTLNNLNNLDNELLGYNEKEKKRRK